MRTRETCQGRDASHRPPSSVASQWVRKNLAATVPFYAGTIFGRTIFAHGYKISILGTKIKQKRGRVWSTLKKYYSGIFATPVPVVQITTRDVNKFCASSSKVFFVAFLHPRLVSMNCAKFRHLHSSLKYQNVTRTTTSTTSPVKDPCQNCNLKYNAPTNNSNNNNCHISLFHQ